MKTVKIELTLEVKDSVAVEDIVSDLKDCCCFDDCKSFKIKTEEKEYDFENEYFEGE